MSVLNDEFNNADAHIVADAIRYHGDCIIKAAKIQANAITAAAGVGAREQWAEVTAEREAERRDKRGRR